MHNNNIYRWLDGTPCMPGGSEYTNWCPCNGNPNHGGENYMFMQVENDGYWADTRGSRTIRYTCETGLI